MSTAIEEAIGLSVMAAVMLVVFIVGLRRRNGWEWVAPWFIPALLILVWFNLHGYVFKGR